MRIILIVILLSTVLSSTLFAQDDFKSLDKQTYDLYLKGDYKNLKKTGDHMIAQGMDYYYLRMRIALLAYNKQQYSAAFTNFSKALEYNKWDTISSELIYYSYRNSGRVADGNLYLETIPVVNRNNGLRTISNPLSTEFSASTSFSAYNQVLYSSNNQYYEAVKNGLSFNAGISTYFSSRFKANFLFTNYKKTGTLYSSNFPSGTNLNFSQNQLYSKLAWLTYPGWETYGYAHFAFYTQLTGKSLNQETIDYTAGVGISKSGWKIRTGINLSLSNLGNSSQARGEGFFIWLPGGNINLYLTSGGMYQIDPNWGNSYQINQEMGSKIFRFLWVETGIIGGNSFLYSRNQGASMNNSFQIPSFTYYENFIFLPAKRVTVTFTSFYNKSKLFSWDITNYKKSNEQNINSFGGSIKLTFKINK